MTRIFKQDDGKSMSNHVPPLKTLCAPSPNIKPSADASVSGSPYLEATSQLAEHEPSSSGISTSVISGRSPRNPVTPTQAHISAPVQASDLPSSRVATLRTQSWMSCSGDPENFVSRASFESLLHLGADSIADVRPPCADDKSITSPVSRFAPVSPQSKCSTPATPASSLGTPGLQSCLSSVSSPQTESSPVTPCTTVSDSSPSQAGRWQGSVQIKTDARSVALHKQARRAPLVTRDKTEVSYRSNPVIYDQSTGELGFADPEDGDRVGALVSTHPAFRSTARKTRHNDIVNIDEVLDSWQKAGRGRLPIGTPTRTCPDAKSADQSPRPDGAAQGPSTTPSSQIRPRIRDGMSSFSNSSTDTVAATTSTLGRKWRPSPRLRAAFSKIPPLIRVDRTGRDSEKTCVPAATPTIMPAVIVPPAMGLWTFALTSPEMSACRAEHELPPLRPISADAAGAHPHHAFEWDAQRLACRVSHSAACALCGSACCRLRALRIHEKKETRGRPAAEKGNIAGEKKTRRQNYHTSKLSYQIKELERIVGPGIEAFETFIKCTQCARLVCPSCAGRCTRETCGDLVCANCCALGECLLP